MCSRCDLWLYFYESIIIEFSRTPTPSDQIYSSEDPIARNLPMTAEDQTNITQLNQLFNGTYPWNKTLVKPFVKVERYGRAGYYGGIDIGTGPVGSYSNYTYYPCRNITEARAFYDWLFQQKVICLQRPLLRERQ